jgi:NarL family two-component system sensor histidine kinase YdfH
MPRKAQYAGLVFYSFITLLLGTLAVFGAQALFTVIALPLAVLYILLFGFHIGLYWVNLRHHQNRRWSVFYYILQAGLIIALVNFPYGRDSARISILGSTTMCMIGETLGLWGNTRRSLLIGVFYGGLAVLLLFLRVERVVFQSAVSSMLFNALFIVLFMIVLNQQFAEREKAEELAEGLESANARLAANAATIEALTRQTERQRMARELHDTLAQGLSGLVLQLEAAKAHLAADRTDRAAAILEQALTRARGTLAESRAAIDDLRAAPASLSEAIRERVNRFTQATGIPCTLEMALPENSMPIEGSEHLVSIFSEALANVARHAQATQVNVRFVIDKGKLELEVRDDGKGFDVNRETNDGHYGLLGMRERARLIGGVLIIESGPQQGTSIHFTLLAPHSGERP